MLTVLMATHNGAATLPRVLGAYLEMSHPSGGWRLVVVDNASNDKTQEILKSFVGRLPLISLHTEQRGKNVALNIGLSQIDGDIVVLTDDDAVPEENWLVTWRNVADKQHDFDIFGGKINPIWPENLPIWIPRLVNLGATYAITPEELTSGPVPATQIWGPNMVIRTTVFRDGHRFNEEFGPQAAQYIMGSEVEFTCRLEQLGHRAWFAADSIVGHIIRTNQLDRKWIIKRAYRLGRHMLHQERGAIPPSTKLLRGAPRWKYRQLISAYINAWLGFARGNFDQKFLADWEISFLHGYLYEASKSLHGHISAL
jgi:glycosyltransferase involved in cell wall biosynthesis